MSDNSKPDNHPQTGGPTGVHHDKRGAPISFDEWLRLSNDPGYKDIQSTEIGGILVQTRWIGTDPELAVFQSAKGDTEPLLFETVIAAPEAHELNREMWRYKTFEEATTGHEAVVKWVRNFLNGK